MRARSKAGAGVKLLSLCIKMLLVRRFATQLLNESQIKALSITVPTWALDPSRPSLRKRYQFRDFKEAWEFMEIVAKVADEHNHHPEWLNVYNSVDVVLTTHDLKGISNKDLWLAQFMDKAENMVKFEHEEN